MRLSSFKQIRHVISHFLHRFHVIIFVVFVVGGLSFVTLLLNTTVTSRVVSDDAPTQNNFDTATIERIKAMQDANQQTGNLTLPEGRTNPFN